MTDDRPRDAAQDPFALLGLDASYALDAETLRRALLREGARWHPDRYALASAEERDAAEERMTAANRAHATLADPLGRAEALLARAGVTVQGRETCPLFLMEVLELREEVEEGAAGAFERLVARERAEMEALAEAAAAWEQAGMPADGAGSVATALTEASYLHRMLAELRRAGAGAAASGADRREAG